MNIGNSINQFFLFARDPIRKANTIWIIHYVICTNPIRKANTWSQITYAIYLNKIQTRKANKPSQIMNEMTTSFHYLFYYNTKVCITEADISRLIKKTTKGIDRYKLGFRPEDLVTNSNISFWTMTVYLSNIPANTIILITNWLSNTFLICFQKNVQELTQGVLNKMLIKGDYFTIPREAAW